MRTLKHLLGRSLFAVRLDALLMRNEAVVVAFHRVRDDADVSDPLTVDTRTFESYCGFFKRFFNVVPLPSLVTLLENGRAPHRALAITFDDGYRDNYVNLRAVVEETGVPVTLFVSSDHISRGTAFHHDIEHNEEGFFPLTWAELRQMQTDGFEIGSHTRTHFDCGSVDAAVGLASSSLLTSCAAMRCRCVMDL